MHLDSNDTPPKLCPRLSESQIFFTTEHILNCSFLNSQVFCVWRGKTALLMQGKVCDCLALALSKSYSSCFSVTFFFKKHSNVMQVSLVLTFWGLKWTSFLFHIAPGKSMLMTIKHFLCLLNSQKLSKVSFVFNTLGIITTITLKMNCKVIFICTFRMSYSVRNTDRWQDTISPKGGSICILIPGISSLGTRGPPWMRNQWVSMKTGKQMLGLMV